MAVAGSALIRRQTSNPLTSGSLTSRIDQVGHLGDQPQGFGPGRGLADREPRLLEDLGDRVPLGLVVVDDQDGDCRLRPPCHASEASEVEARVPP